VQTPNQKPDPRGRSRQARQRLPSSSAAERGPLDVGEQLKGKRFLVIGGTGFLGKVLVSLMLKEYGEEIEHLYLMVRPKPGLTADERFMQELWPSPCFDPVREGMHEVEAAMWAMGKITPVSGDVTKPRAGLEDSVFAEMKEAGVDAVLNVAGVVSFTPPIDEGFRVNTQGVINLMQLCRDLGTPPNGEGSGPIPLMHTSTCYVAGYNSGHIYEDDPRDHPFPRADELAVEDWSPERELEEGMEIAKNIRARAGDAQLESRFVDAAKEKLRKRQLPTTGEPLEQAVKKERERWLDEQLVDAGTKRARHWGWPNTYTYTKSVGEQLLADGDVPYTIVRPAVVESSEHFPFPGWNEGINTSAPLIYLALHGAVQFPTTPGHVLDVIPVDHVCFGTVLALAALLDDSHDSVYQFGTSDANGLTMFRMTELTGLAKRRHMRSRKRGNPLLNRFFARVEPISVSPERYRRISSPAISEGLGLAGKALKSLGKTPAAPVAKPLERTVSSFRKQTNVVEAVMGAFLPFISELDYRFRCDNTRAVFDRVTEVDQAKLPYKPHDLNWRVYWRECHLPGLKKWVFPHLEARIMKRPRAEERFSDLLALLDEVADREAGRTALQRLTKSGDEAHLEGVSYRDLRRASLSCAARLADVGVHPSSRVALVAKNSPEWAIGFFGVLAAGATVVLLDPELDEVELERRMGRAEVSMALLGSDVEHIGEAACLDLGEFAEVPAAGSIPEPPEVLISPDDMAAVVFTAGTTGEAKPVVLTHRNLTSVLASVAPLFKLRRSDSGLSVLPLHHTFELTCGLLLPLLRGARVTYVDEVTAAELSEAFKVAGITAMIGVPQVWEELEQKIYDDLSDSGPFAEAAFQAGLLLNRTLGKTLGLNLGRVLFRPVHDRLGGKIRFMVSTGGHLPSKTSDTFRSLGIELKQGYGLTEGAPLLTLGDAKGRGEPLPGLEVEVRNAQDGIGEIYARGDQVMLGYLDDDELTERALGKDGWLRTGDLGRVDKKGRISVVARDNEVVTLRDGRRVFPRGVEEELSKVEGVAEIAVVGVPDGQGGERVAALVSLEAGADAEKVERAVSSHARKNLEEHERPGVYELQAAALPRTADRKIVRPDVIAAIVVALAAQETSAMRAVSPAPVEDSAPPTPSSRARLRAPSRGKSKPADTAPIDVPPTMQRAVKRVLREGQKAFYAKGLKTKVTGEQHIPYNRQTILAANHASHLDMGLIKHALGTYGEEIVALAAKDYFFEGKWRRSYFENFTNLRPLDRGDNPRDAMREASNLLQGGSTVLIFPEGTRTVTGEMAAFRPAVAYLALKHGVDILPLYCEGTHRAMPRGSFVPKNRNVEVRIGAPIPAAKLKEVFDGAGLKMSAACQRGAQIVQQAIEALRDGRHFDLDAAIEEALGKRKVEARANPLEELFGDLERRFDPDNVKSKLTYYFSLGAGPESKWTVQVDKSGCNIFNGKLDEPADCVMKTDVKMFTRIVREHYIPQVSEFLDGTVKTNDPELLTAFVQVFNL
jgi:long-chain acyl-CoA synthetase